MTDERWDYSHNCNDCRADLKAVLDELVELDELARAEDERAINRYMATPEAARRTREWRRSILPQGQGAEATD